MCFLPYSFFLFAKLLLNELDLDMQTCATSCQIQHGVLKITIRQVTIWRPFCFINPLSFAVTPVFQLALFVDFINAFILSHSAHSLPFSAAFPEIFCKSVWSECPHVRAFGLHFRWGHHAPRRVWQSCGELRGRSDSS